MVNNFNFPKDIKRTYSPFNKNISELQKNDLNILIENEVSEGWYVEYKSIFPSNKKISHSIASFANSEGGWYIVGVKTNENHAADSIDGFNLNDNPNPKDKIASIVKDCINPLPFYESKLIKLSCTNAVLIIKIEKGYETPYITRDGRLYIRKGEETDPVPENDYYSIRKLYERKNIIIDQIEKFSFNPFPITVTETYIPATPFLETYLFTLPRSNFSFNNFYSKDFFLNFQEVFNLPKSFISDDFTSTIKYKNAYSSSNSYILRSFSDNQLPIDSIEHISTLELFFNGNMKIFCPFSILYSGPPKDFLKNSIPDLYKNNIKIFRDIILEYRYENFITIIDGFSFFIFYLNMLKSFSDLLNQNNYQDDFGIRFRMLNINGTILFFDSEKYNHFLKKYGIPICNKCNIEIPSFNDGNIIKMSNDQKNFFKSNIYLLIFISEALGIPMSILYEIFPDISHFIHESSKYKNK